MRRVLYGSEIRSQNKEDCTFFSELIFHFHDDILSSLHTQIISRGSQVRGELIRNAKGLVKTHYKLNGTVDQVKKRVAQLLDRGSFSFRVRTYC